ncbi:copper-binding protein, partial [Vibrio parahaemolyticus]
MRIVAADGQDVQPVTVDEFQFGPGETYDAIVAPAARAYAIAAETMDRSGMARGTLAPAPGMVAPVPPLRPRPILSMQDMGMDMPGMD